MAISQHTGQKTLLLDLILSIIIERAMGSQCSIAIDAKVGILVSN